MGKAGGGGGGVFLLALAFAFLTLLLVVVFHAMAWLGLAQDLGLLEHKQAENWEVQELDIVETSWLSPLWCIVYALQFAWLLYAFSLGCKHYRTGTLIMDPPILPTSVFLTFALGVAGSLGWVVLWDSRTYCVYSAICMLGATIFLSLSVAVSLHATKLYQEEVIGRGYISDVWTIRALVQNALAVYVAWTFVLTAYTIAMILKRFELLEADTAQYVGLSIMMGHVVIWMFLDVWNARALTHFILLPYLLYIVVFLQPVLSHVTAMTSSYFIMAAVYLTMTAIFVVIKVTAAVCRCRQSAKALQAEEEEFGAIEYKEDPEDLGNVTLVHTHFPDPRSRVVCDPNGSFDDVSITSSSRSNPNNADFDNDNSSQVAFITLDRSVSNDSRYA